MKTALVALLVGLAPPVVQSHPICLAAPKLHLVAAMTTERLANELLEERAVAVVVAQPLDDAAAGEEGQAHTQRVLT